MREPPINLRMPEPVRNRWKTLTDQVGKREHWMVACAGVVQLLRMSPDERLRLLDEINSARFRQKLEEFMAQFDPAPPPSKPDVANINRSLRGGGLGGIEHTGLADEPRLPPETPDIRTPRKRSRPV